MARASSLLLCTSICSRMAESMPLRPAESAEFELASMPAIREPSSSTSDAMRCSRLFRVSSSAASRREVSASIRSAPCSWFTATAARTSSSPCLRCSEKVRRSKSRCLNAISSLVRRVPSSARMAATAPWASSHALASILVPRAATCASLSRCFASDSARAPEVDAAPLSAVSSRARMASIASLSLRSSASWDLDSSAACSARRDSCSRLLASCCSRCAARSVPSFWISLPASARQRGSVRVVISECALAMSSSDRCRASTRGLSASSTARTACNCFCSRASLFSFFSSRSCLRASCSSPLWRCMSWSLCSWPDRSASCPAASSRSLWDVCSCSWTIASSCF
mmetsp:Transcript_8519/g.24048  ORF Transcript_8519/g.24048 Transcript_8519/m.24048 type:complete len:342 (-) Transcript_8519:250-1275(-)